MSIVLVWRSSGSDCQTMEVTTQARQFEPQCLHLSEMALSLKTPNYTPKLLTPYMNLSIICQVKKIRKMLYCYFCYFRAESLIIITQRLRWMRWMGTGSRR